MHSLPQITSLSIFASIKDIFYWILEIHQQLYVTEQGQLIQLPDKFLYGLKQKQNSNSTYPARSSTQGIRNLSMTSAYSANGGSKFSCVSTHSDDLLHCINGTIMANEFKTQPIKTHTDIQYHENASSYIGIKNNRSVDLSKFYMSRKGVLL